MKHAKRTQWYLWQCDLDGCNEYETTHDILEETSPPGWVTIEPPRYWKGPALAFCSDNHRDQFMGGYLQDQIRRLTA